VVPRAGSEGAGQRVVPYRHTSALYVPDVGWCACMLPQGLPSGVVVSMDWGAYKYLVNRAVPTVLVTTKQHLDVCCLRRFRMVPWRSTNDVKVGASGGCRAAISHTRITTYLHRLGGRPRGLGCPRIPKHKLLNTNSMIHLHAYTTSAAWDG
jgi:hypothetical protein